MSPDQESQAGGGAAATTTEAAAWSTRSSTACAARGDDQRTWGRDLVKELVAQLLDPKLVVKKDTERTINARIDQIDQLLSAQLNEIMHHPTSPSWRARGAACTTSCTRARPARRSRSAS